MKSFGIFAASALFGAIANAAPVNKRAVVWVTETAIDVVTVPVTKTVWAGAEETTVATTSTQTRHQFWHSKSSKAKTTSSSVYVAPTLSSTSVYVAPTSTSVYVAPTTSSSSVYVAPTTSSSSVYVAPTTSSTSEYVAPTTSSTSEYVAPTTSSVEVAPTTSSVEAAPTTSSVEAAPSTSEAPTLSTSSVYQAAYTSATSVTSSAAAAATSSSSSSGTSSGLAASGTEYTGDLTWYETGTGACGLTSGSSDPIVAISQDIFDSPAYKTANPNNNPLCGKTVTIQGKDGNSYKATVVDRCVGCAESDLDLSQGFFNKVTSNGDGRVSGMTWTWD